MDAVYLELEGKITSTCSKDRCYNSGHTTNVQQVKEAVQGLKRGKRDGSVGHSSDHIINATDRLHTTMSLLYSAMVCHGYVPEDMLLSTVIPITVNSRKSLFESDNYRRVAL